MSPCTLLVGLAVAVLAPAQSDAPRPNIGGALTFLVLGAQEADLFNWPLPGMRGYVAPPIAAIPLFAGGTAAVAGNGSWGLPVQIPPGLSGSLRKKR